MIIMRKRLWSPDEDEKLQKYVTENGYGNWSDVAKKAGLQRCGKSCRLRWINYLRPNLKRGKFTPQEKMMIIGLQKVFGNSWSKIAIHLPGRTDSDIKNFWHSHFRKKQPFIVGVMHDSIKLEEESQCLRDQNNIYTNNNVNHCDDVQTTFMHVNSSPTPTNATSYMPLLVEDREFQYSSSERNLNQLYNSLFTHQQCELINVDLDPNHQLDDRNGFIVPQEHELNLLVKGGQPQNVTCDSTKGLLHGNHITWTSVDHNELSFDAVHAMLNACSVDQISPSILDDQSSQITIRPPEGLELVVWSCNNHRSPSTCSMEL